MKIISLAVLVSIAVTGCVPLVSVNLVQRVVSDLGDDTSDAVTSKDEKTTRDETNLKLLVPLK